MGQKRSALIPYWVFEFNFDYRQSDFCSIYPIASSIYQKRLKNTQFIKPICVIQLSYYIKFLNNFQFKSLNHFQNHNFQKELVRLHFFMASFHTQSTFLDLKKTYQKFEYESLTAEQVVIDETGDKEEEIYQGMTQNTYLFVQEKTVLIKDIQNLAAYFLHKFYEVNPNIKQSVADKFPFQKVKERVCFIFQKYQEQPSLLDSLLQSLIMPIMNSIKLYLALILRTEAAATQQFHSLLMIIYQLTKVRGKKYVMQYFPHEVKDLYPAIGYLVRQKDDQNTSWQSRYVILLWLGVIVLVPFDLEIIDSSQVKMKNEKGQQVTQIIDLLIQIGKHYLKSLTKMREASALFLGKIFTRPDIQKRELLKGYAQFCLQKLEQFKNNPMETFFVCGLYLSLKQIFKRVQRKQLLPLISPILNQMDRQRQTSKANAAKTQLKMKLIKRIGLCYLKPRIVTWAYRKKKQSLLSNLEKSSKNQIKSNTNASITKMQNKDMQQGQVEDSEIDYYRDVNKQSLEKIIDMLVDGLSQKETAVRQAASKGLGMICGRLSQDMVRDVLDYILDLTPNPRTQHAICLTIAELTRRNLLSPEKVRQLYPLMKQSLLYEKEEGGYSIGQSVRDSACYMTWSVARGYQQGGQELGTSLMIAACFDRQVGCRRAASAAYQQLVGRVGDVPNGIQILTEADYFTLGMQKNAFLNVAIFVASYQAYFKPFVQHLAYQKLRHWDIQVKRIGACSLSLMCPLNPEFIARQMLPSMAKFLDSDQMNVKLGTVIGIGQIMMGLKGLSHLHQLHNEMKDSVFLKSLTQNQKKLMKAGQYMTIFKQKYGKIKNKDTFHLISQETLKEIAQNLAMKIKDGNIYKGKAGESLRIYTCRLLQVFGLCGMPLTNQQIEIFKDFIQQNIKNPLQAILNAAVKCLKPFLAQYHIANRDQKFIQSFIANSKVVGGNSRGYTLALSKFSRDIYLHHTNQLIETFQENTKVIKFNDDPDKRKHAIKGIESMATEIGFNTDSFTQQHINRIFNLFGRTMNDYTTDKRGDIGSIVRQASMSAMIAIIRKYCQEKQKKWKIDNSHIERMVGLFLQQLSEKIDRIRLLAGSLLQQFFDQCHQHFNIPDQKLLYNTFCQQNIKKLIKESQSKIDSNLETQVIEMEMKIQQTIFMESERYLIYFWNLPHSTFPIIVPFLALENYSIYILKGLCTSTGGISQSIIKFSLQELGQYLTKISVNQPKLLQKLFRQIIQVLTAHFKDERIVIPMYKTLDYILQRPDIIAWEGIKQIDGQLFALIQKQTGKTKNILKVSAATGLYVSLLSINNSNTKTKIEKNIVKILCSDLPKARKVLADKLLFFLMSQEEFETFDQQKTEQFMNILSQHDFLDEKLDVQTIKVQLCTLLNIQL